MYVLDKLNKKGGNSWTTFLTFVVYDNNCNLAYDIKEIIKVAIVGNTIWISKVISEVICMPESTKLSNAVERTSTNLVNLFIKHILTDVQFGS